MWKLILLFSLLFFFANRQHFDDILFSMVRWWSNPVVFNSTNDITTTNTTNDISENDVFDAGLLPVYEACERWIHKARRYVNMVPANFRSTLQVFQGQEFGGETTQHYVFNFNRNVERLLTELNSLVTFLWRHTDFNHCCVSYLKDSSVNVKGKNYIPKLLKLLFLENIQGYKKHPIILQYCQAKCFRMNKKSNVDNNNNELVMIRCGTIASTFGNVVAILRAGICSYIVTKDMNDAAAKELVESARSSRTLNIISPMISVLRAMENRKPNSREPKLGSDFLITIDSFIY